VSDGPPGTSESYTPHWSVPIGHRTPLIGPGPLLCWLLHQLVFPFSVWISARFSFFDPFSSFILLKNIYIFGKFSNFENGSDSKKLNFEYCSDSKFVQISKFV
jgi:hypothetical protein